MLHVMCFSVCLSVDGNREVTGIPIEVPFGVLWTRVGSRNRLLGVGPDPQCKGQFGGIPRQIVEYREYPACGHTYLGTPACPL